ncbi:MAG: hypothetical protein IJT98_10890 [Prevotella sp.]|nr:hypothetical protein [Prevotella sp.]
MPHRVTSHKWLPLLLCSLTVRAQHDVFSIDVAPTSPILPPQVGDYMQNPGKYFNITVTNKTDESQLFYLCLQMEQTQDGQGLPASLSVATPPEYPGTPFQVGPRGTLPLTQEDMRRLFNHIPLSAMRFSGDMFNSLGQNDYGLLPEGKYRISIVAYKWDQALIGQDSKIASPVSLSAPDLTGFNTFDICYRAQAPQFITPATSGGVEELRNLQVVKLPLENPLFAWMEPLLNCQLGLVNYEYKLTIREVLNGQSPDEAMEHGSDILVVPGIHAPQYLLGTNHISKLLDGHIYVAQVTATQRNTTTFTLIENQGKSPIVVFTPKMTFGEEVAEEQEEPTGGGDDDDDSYDITMEHDGSGSAVDLGDNTYVFRYPQLTKPDFNGNTNRALFQGASVCSEWQRPAYLGGKGEKQDTVKFRYRTELYNLSGYATRELALEQGLIYSSPAKGSMDATDAEKTLNRQKNGVDLLQDYIPWDTIKSNVSIGQVFLLRLVPEALTDNSVKFEGEPGELAFQYTDSLSNAFGNACAEGKIEANRVPIECSDNNMRGKKVFVGEYEMLMGDDVKQNNDSHAWSGTGWMLWEPMGQTVKVGVKFENIFINSDYIMYEGVVKSNPKSNWEHLKERATAVSETNTFDEWIPDDIFTDWGLDNLVGYATPDALKPYLTGYTDQLGQEVNGLAQKVKASKYYDYVKKGYAVYDNFMQVLADGTMPDVEVFLPLQIPESVNKSPIDIQLISMEWQPTRAYMNLLGMFSLPDNDVTENNILMFGAPKMCMDPDRLLPGSGNIILLEDVTLKESSSGFNFTFKAPTDTENPQDGCMMSWAADTISFLSLRAEMEIPDLTKVNDKGVKEDGQMPKAIIEAQIHDWEDWWGHVTMDPFEADDLPGWTFTTQDIIYDHSQRWNPSQIHFADNYFDPARNDNAYQLPPSVFGQKAWQGLYIGKISMQMPKGFLENGEGRFSVAGTDMIFDKSGLTASFGMDQIVDCSAGGWALRVKKLAIDIQQTTVKGGTMQGDVHVPLTDEGDYIAFQCDMLPQENEQHPGAIDFLLRIQPTDDGQNDLDGKLHFDFWLADLTLDNKQTYFLLEAIDKGDDQGYDTRVELCMGGDITISAADDANKTLAQYDQQVKHYVPGLPFDLRIPGVHFTQMRLANCPRSNVWTHGQQIRQTAEGSIAADEQTVNTILSLYENKTFILGEGEEKFYFDCGSWSLASFDKQLGPFKFALEKYNFNQSGNDIELELKGSIGFLMKDQKNPLVTASTTVALLAEADVKNLSFKYKDTQFRQATVDIDMAGIKIYGQLDIENGTGNNSEKGYGGTLKFSMPGDLFHIDASGGYYTHQETNHNYTYGWFYAAAGGEALRFDPIVINNIGAGFYFNCVRNVDSHGNEQKATPQEGMIGAVAKLDLASSDGELVKQGTFDMTVLYDRTNNRLTSMLFTGQLKAAAGMVDSKATIAWVHNDEDKYFQLNVTADVKADGALDAEVGKLSTSLANKLSELNSQYEQAVCGVKAGLKDAIGVKPGEGTSDPQKAENKTEDFSAKGNGISANISLDLKITFMEKGKKYDNCKWHVYLGEPDFAKRCSLTLIDLKAGPVSVKVGANMYLCIGNELPNDGELPPIPTTIATFLNGESKGGMEGADIYKAQRAREASKKQFAADAQAGGGFMLGAEVYGYVDIDLGIFYGGMGVDAGFDVSVRKLAYPVCTGTSDGRMGYNGWYGEGQLYAYLAAKFGIHVNFGFWKDDFDIINAGIGGVLRCGLPHPNYFIGSARVKLKLMGGMVNINRRFSFECGTRCSIFYGNPLDNFELFGDCTLGVPEMKEGWADAADRIDPGLLTQARFETQAPLDANFRVLDETSLNELLQSYESRGIEREQLEMQAKRTFVFRRTGNAYLYEFTIRPDSTLFNEMVMKHPGDYPSLQFRQRMGLANITSLSVRDFSQTTHGLQLTGAQLSKNRFYVIMVTGAAKEIVRGVEQDPRTFHPEANWQGDRWTQEPWTQTQCYFFRTGESEALDDDTPLQDFVAIAYPSVRNSLNSSSNNGNYVFTDTYPTDIVHPTIALNSDIRGRVYQNGKLRWRLYYTPSGTVSGYETLVCEADNSFLQNGNCINMVPDTVSNWADKAQQALDSNKKHFRIAIDYDKMEIETSSDSILTGYRTKNVMLLGRRKPIQVTVPVYNIVTTADTTYTTIAHLMNVAVKSVNGNWYEGYTTQSGIGGSRRVFADYSKPFMGTSVGMVSNGLSDYDYNWTDTNIAQEVRKQSNVPLRTYDPYVYLSYLGNFFFIGGHPIKNYAFETGEDANGDAVPVSESLIYHDRGGVWSGNLVAGQNDNIYRGVSAVRQLSVNTNYSAYGDAGHQFPLPVFTGSDSWCNSLILGGQSNMTAPPMAARKMEHRFYRTLWDIAAVYYLAEQAGEYQWNAADRVPLATWQKNSNTVQQARFSGWYYWFHKKQSNDSPLCSALKDWNNTYRGLYLVHELSYTLPDGETSEPVTVQIPMYQFPLLVGSQYSPSNAKGWNHSVPSLSNSERTNQEWSTKWLHMYQRSSSDNYWTPSWVKGTNFSSYSAQDALRRINSLSLTVYRVNAFDINTMTYDCLSLFPGQSTEMQVWNPTGISVPFNSWKSDYKWNGQD